MRLRLKATAEDFFLHASAVATPDGVALFSGPSGSGKSTVAELVSSQTSWPVMADDVTRIWVHGGVWVAEDGCHALFPSNGGHEWPISHFRGVPVITWFSIRQAPRAASSVLMASEACARMVAAWLEVAGHSSPYDPIAGLRVFPGIVAFARSIPALTLDCTLYNDTVQVVCDSIKCSWE